MDSLQKPGNELIDRREDGRGAEWHASPFGL